MEHAESSNHLLITFLHSPQIAEAGSRKSPPNGPKSITSKVVAQIGANGPYNIRVSCPGIWPKFYSKRYNAKGKREVPWHKE